ncbi:MAG: hypothetical protein LN408_06590, partial [Candidatus Thermoplasmatota archaeon]|nr:hypothetical protein [Candidatus Thermoplasmatota archaeon]
YPKNANLKNYICGMMYNINNNYYGNNVLDITGPGLLGKYIKKNILLKNNVIANDWQNSYITFNNKIFIMK